MLVKLPPHTFDVAVTLCPQCTCPRCFGSWSPSPSGSLLMSHSCSLPCLAQPPPAPALLIFFPCCIFPHRLQHHLTSYSFLSVAPHQNISSWRTEPLSGASTAEYNGNRYFPVGELQALRPHLLQLCALSIALQFCLKRFSQVQSSPGYWGVEIIFTHVQLK